MYPTDGLYPIGVRIQCLLYFIQYWVRPGKITLQLIISGFLKSMWVGGWSLSIISFGPVQLVTETISCANQIHSICLHHLAATKSAVV